ncbi:hypothetical protein CEXT_101702 [Caerostris extrusa]|uniref:Uncharacterized protein n=1 Tax=Caerostris extrusa TaxID=172846 RepID=A0AAV4N578_CAEEX|nr:hypothetical protein CEXT_101702 [Caerostris extrusa]
MQRKEMASMAENEIFIRKRMYTHGFLLCFILLSHILVCSSQQKRIPCWTRQKCDTCTRRSRIGQLSLCCEGCAVGKLSVRVTKAKAYCWCLTNR